MPPIRLPFRHLVRALAVALLACTSWAEGKPYIPQNGAQVIETLPRRSDPVQRALLRQRAELAAQPRNLTLATSLAQRYIAMARSETDPRYLGYAQAALAPWWSTPAAPPAVRLLRATILQSTHHFEAALTDLDGVIAAEPGNGQAWLTRAIVRTVRGDYAGARTDCARLSSLANELVTATCLTNIGSVTGSALQSERLLERMVERGAGADPELQVWSLTLLADMASRRGAAANAQARYQRALAGNPGDSYLLGAYADFLLEQGRPAEVLTLLQDQDRIDALLLRRALALQQMPGNAAALADATAELGRRFDAAMRRGDSVHQREQARFELSLRRDAAAALRLARQNWLVQKETPDMVIYLEAALRAGDPAAARPVLDWVRANRTEDVAIARLTGQLQLAPQAR
ncbi:MAG: hypothetical protein V4754_09485 [Pseudomonadota bacterium]